MEKIRFCQLEEDDAVATVSRLKIKVYEKIEILLILGKI